MRASEDPVGFEVRCVRDGSRSMVHVAGGIDVTTSTALEEQLMVFADEAVEDLVLDFSDVTFLDSTGLTALVRVRKALDARQLSLSIRNAHDAALRALDVAQMTDYLRVE